MPRTETTTSLHVGIVLARENTDHKWQSERWRPVEVLVGVKEIAPGTIVKEGAGFEHYFADTLELEMHRKETPGYLVNLADAQPSVYVVLCEAEDDDAALPYVVRLVTVSPFEAQDFLDTGEDIVEAIPMAPPLQAWVEAFVEKHHVEEKFVKRQRDRVDLKHEKFGQEPITIIRERRNRKFDA